MGKSLLMQQLMTAAATGKQWFDRSMPRCKTFGLFGEDPEDESWRRREDISRFYDVEHGTRRRRCRHRDSKSISAKLALA